MNKKIIALQLAIIMILMNIGINLANDYTGITDLLSYAKKNSSVYSQTLTTTSPAYYKSDNVLFDGYNLLENKAYYYIYVQFDDENGKYCPIEGVTLGQAWIGDSNKYWDLLAYTADNFEYVGLFHRFQVW